MFGGTNQKLPAKKPATTGKAEPGQKPKAYDPNDMTVEGNLRRVIDEQGVNEALKNQELDLEEGVDAPLIRLVNALLSQSVTMGASDIHIEPFETILRIRFRIDGVLQEVQTVPHKLASPISTRLKVMAALDICEKRLPQDGTIKLRNGDIVADFRMSTLPSAFGEKIVLRVMGTASVKNDLSKLGIPERELKIIRNAIKRPDGLVLVTGPTGSGKTTTLYAALNELNDISESVFTAEDPIEGTLQGVTQCQVNTAVGYTFASILRSLLRQDPDIILVGEIRDQETAEISIKAALTGHLVLSTLHTNCSASTISRLLNMGIQGYLITSSVTCVVAQRLVRRVCNDCKHTRPAPPDLLEKIGAARALLNESQLVYGKGCPKCNGTGYKGRAPIYEVLQMSEELRSLVLTGAHLDTMRKQARKEGMRTLRESGIELVRQGITTIDEVLGASNEDDQAEMNSQTTNTSLPEQKRATTIATQAVKPQAKFQSLSSSSISRPTMTGGVSTQSASSDSRWRKT
jgi:type IV pilus assembly protein PilB